MKEIAFTIYGNQEKPDGNPIPYHRTTQGSFWNKGSRRYQAWKEYVVANYLDAVLPDKKIKREDFGQMHDLLSLKPITLKDNERAQMDIMIYWKNDAHADCDNIFKGIADALFVNDKKIWAGGFLSFPASDKKGRVEVRITIEEE